MVRINAVERGKQKRLYIVFDVRYEYDRHMNWTRRILEHKGAVTGITVREMEYY